MESTDCGRELTCVQTIDRPGAMDAVVVGQYLYVVSTERLTVADITNPVAPVVVGECAFRGRGRQVVVADGIAYVTARADGVHIIDVHDPRRPELLCHYDCIELATGIEVQGRLLFVAQRQYGVEIVDVADPRRPAYVSKVKTGEAQSIDVRGDLLYVGDWGTRELTVVDIADAYAPRIIGSQPLDGFGDGVCVAGEYLYASTGHHARNGSSLPRYPFALETDAGYGAGHGVEVFSLRDPRRPEFLGRAKFPKYYSRDGFDMWSPVAAGDVVCCADALGGVFLVDVSEPRQPRLAAHFRELVGGVAVADGVVYAACPKAGLKVLPAPGLVRHCPPDRSRPVRLAVAPPAAPDKGRVYRLGGQVWSVAFCGPYAVVAAGMGGLRLVELWPEFREVSRLEGRDCVVHACAAGDRVYVSENTGGFSIWQHAGLGQLQPLGRFETPANEAVRQGMVYANGTRAVLHVGSRFLVLDVSDPTAPRQIAEYHATIIYGDQMSHGDLGGRYACVWCHIKGIRWLDLGAEAGAVDTRVTLADAYSFFAGVVAVGDQFLCTFPGAYRLAGPLDTDLQAKPAYRFDKSFLGKPSVYGNGLFLSSRVGSAVAIVDITDREQPRLLRRLSTLGNPGTAVVRNEALIIPDGNGGLLVYDDFVNTLDLDVDKQRFLGL